MTPPEEPLRVLIAGAWDDGPGYPRTRALRAALERLPVRIALCREPPPSCGQSKQKLIRSPWRWPGFWLDQRRARRSLQSTLRIALREFRPDVVFVPYPGHSTVHWVREQFPGRIVLDLFLSAHDTVVEDRQLLRADSLGARFLRRLDGRACAAADMVLMDTPQGAARACEQTGLPEERFDWVPIGDPDAPAGVPTRDSEPTGRRGLELVYLGTGVPLHGLAHLLDAFDPAFGPAGESSAKGWKLKMIGGDRKSRDRAAALPSVDLGPRFVDAATWTQLLRDCDAVAGVFGESPKADRVVPFKVVHGLAAGRVVLTGATAAIAARLTEEECVTVPVADGLGIRAALNALAADPNRRMQIESAARGAFDREFSPAALAEHWRRVLRLPVAADPSGAAACEGRVSRGQAVIGRGSAVEVVQ